MISPVQARWGSPAPRAWQGRDVGTALGQVQTPFDTWLKRWLRLTRPGPRRSSERTQPVPSLLQKHVRHRSPSLMPPHILDTDLKGGLFGVTSHHFSGKCLSGPDFHLPWCFANNSGTFVGHLAVAGLMTRQKPRGKVFLPLERTLLGK